MIHHLGVMKLCTKFASIQLLLALHEKVLNYQCHQDSSSGHHERLNQISLQSIKYKSSYFRLGQSVEPNDRQSTEHGLKLNFQANWKLV